MPKGHKPEGSGRQKMDDDKKRRKRSLSIAPETDDILDQQDNPGKYVDKAVRAQYRRDTRKAKKAGPP